LKCVAISQAVPAASARIATQPAGKSARANSVHEKKVPSAATASSLAGSIGI
jgi:hypothetical protein